MGKPKMCFLASSAPEAQQALRDLKQLYPHHAPMEADVLVPLGGDGFMLKVLHQYQPLGKPVYGMNCGSVGFLMNQYQVDGLEERISHAQRTDLYPLKMEAQCQDGSVLASHAINEVSLLRQTYQAAWITVEIDGVLRLDPLVADGILIATPAGSTAYNLSVSGPILPIGAPLLALTPTSPFRPRRWRGALLPEQSRVTFIIQDPDKRPVSATADDFEVRHVKKVEVYQDKTFSYQLLFDLNHNLEERILREQFLT
jgi:NAD+ kinase